MIPKEIPPLTTYEISRYLHVDLTTVISWCELGRIKAYKTPGGHRRVRPEFFLEFLKEYNMPIPQEFADRLKNSLKILIVDDEEEIRKMIRRALRQSIACAEIHEARDGFEAGILAADLLPGLIILDLMMPGINGFKVCGNIKKDARFKATKILAITGQDTEENKQKILKEGADEYLAKPFDVKDLIKKAHELLEIAEEKVNK